MRPDVRAQACKNLDAAASAQEDATYRRLIDTSPRAGESDDERATRFGAQARQLEALEVAHKAEAHACARLSPSDKVGSTIRDLAFVARHHGGTRPAPSFGGVWDAFAEARRLGGVDEPDAPSANDVIAEEADADPEGNAIAGATMVAWFSSATPETARSYWQSLAKAGTPMDLGWLERASPEVQNAIAELIASAEPYEEEPRSSVTQAVGCELTKKLTLDWKGASTPEVAVSRMKARMARFTKTHVELTRARSESGDRRMGRDGVRLTTPRWGRHVRRAPRRVRRARVAIRGAPSSDADPAGGDPPPKRRLARAQRRHLSSSRRRS
jgi:hypothetical protein